MAGLSSELASFVAKLKPADLPQTSILTVQRGIADCVGVMLAGQNEPVVEHAIHLIRVCQNDPCRVLSGGTHASAEDAAFVNSVAAHALDYDDTGLDGHPSAVLAPVVLAEAQRLGLTWMDAITAYIAGYETWAELISREAEKHHAKGWHPTATFGVLASAAATSWLGKFDDRTTAHALGIAASMAGGLVANFGSMTKPLQVGWAARNGMVAARLAGRGATSASDALESPRGFLAAVSPSGNVRRDGTSQAGITWQISHQGLNIKRYPVCYAVHRAIDAAASLAQELQGRHHDICHMTLSIGKFQAAMLRSECPDNSLDAKFSAQFAVACAILNGGVTLSNLTSNSVNQPDMQRLQKLVKIVSLEEQDPEDPLFSPADQLQVVMRSGEQILSLPVAKAAGHASRPLTEQELELKFRDCALTSLGEASASRWWSELMHSALDGPAAIPAPRHIQSAHQQTK